MSLLETLPSEIQATILLHLDLTSLGVTARLSKTLLQAVSDPYLWLLKLRDRFPDRDFSKTRIEWRKDVYLNLVARSLERRATWFIKRAPSHDQRLIEIDQTLRDLAMRKRILQDEQRRISQPYYDRGTQLNYRASELRRKARTIHFEEKRRFINILVTRPRLRQFLDWYMEVDHMISVTELEEYWKRKFQLLDLVCITTGVVEKQIDGPMLFYIYGEEFEDEQGNYDVDLQLDMKVGAIPGIMIQECGSLAEIQRRYKPDFSIQKNYTVVYDKEN